MMNTGYLIVYAIPLTIILIVYTLRRIKKEANNARILQENIQAGLTEPASLHPLIDKEECIACGSCVTACPEGNVLGLIRGKAELINPTYCIGHGACKTACPIGAISLVFGTEKRGMDIPMVQPNFETNVRGMFIAGELGGMGLIRNAITQGRQAMDSIIKRGKGKAPLDVVIIGAGPAGFAAALSAKKHGLKYVVLEQESFGGTVAHFPRGKLVMTAPVDLPLVGKVNFRETTKEALMEFWDKVRNRYPLNLKYHERVDKIEKSANGFNITSTKGNYQAHSVLLSIGRRGTPRKLGVPGEDQEKVVYRLIDPEQYKGRHVLVVGGGDAAMEAALSISEQPQTSVTLSYRSEAFSRAKPKNRSKVEEATKSGRLQTWMKSQVKRIDADTVTLDYQGSERTIKNQAVIICAGGILPTKFLQSIGIEVETKYGTE